MDRQSAQVSASGASFTSLEQLDPSPVDSPFDDEKTFDDGLSPAPLARGSNIGLSGSGHGAVFYLQRIQRYSSYAFTVFAAVHLANTSLIPLATRSVGAAEPYLLLTRPLYQSAAGEPLLVALPLALHVGAGLALRVLRRSAALRRYGGAQLGGARRRAARVRVWPRLSRTAAAGYALVPLVATHAAVNRLLPWAAEGTSAGVGLGFVAHGFARHPRAAALAYVALVGVGVGHVVWGWARWLGWSPPAPPASAAPGTSGAGERPGAGRWRERRWWTINAISLAATALWMAGGMGVVARGGAAAGWVGAGYDGLFAKIPLVEM